MEKTLYEIMKDGIIGMAIGDALGVPVEFQPRAERENDPVLGMRGFGSWNLPAGSWSDDTSMALATLDSLAECGRVDCADIMRRYDLWVYHDQYNVDSRRTFDVGITISYAVHAYHNGTPLDECGRCSEHDNGNGSLMRILPACVWAYGTGMSDAEAVQAVHDISALTHGHLRAKMACGLYYFLVKAVLDRKGKTLNECLQQGMDAGFAFYRQDPANLSELAMFGRMEDLAAFRELPMDQILSTGYVLASFEAAVWCLLLKNTYKGAMLCAVNLGKDTDTVAAIAGGLAGLWYGMEGMPADWLDTLRDKAFIDSILAKVK